MKVTAFIHHFIRVKLSDRLIEAAEVRFTVKGVEMRVDMVHVEIGDPTTWTVTLDNDPATDGHVLTRDEAVKAFGDHEIEGRV